MKTLFLLALVLLLVVPSTLSVSQATTSTGNDSGHKVLISHLHIAYQHFTISTPANYTIHCGTPQSVDSVTITLRNVDVKNYSDGSWTYNFNGLFLWQKNNVTVATEHEKYRSAGINHTITYLNLVDNAICINGFHLHEHIHITIDQQTGRLESVRIQ